MNDDQIALAQLECFHGRMSRLYARVAELERENAELRQGIPGGGWTFEQYLRRKQQWSVATFGPDYRPLRLIRHIRKELEEVAETPYEPREWLDIAEIALDGAWRCSGVPPLALIEMLEQKHAINLQRDWPDWRTADHDSPMEHVRQEPV